MNFPFNGGHFNTRTPTFSTQVRLQNTPANSFQGFDNNFNQTFNQPSFNQNPSFQSFNNQDIFVKFQQLIQQLLNNLNTQNPQQPSVNPGNTNPNPSNTLPPNQPQQPSGDIPVTRNGDLYTIGDINRSGAALVRADELPGLLEEFRNSDRAPSIASADLVTTDWGYRGSGSVLREFYQYVFDTQPRAIA